VHRVSPPEHKHATIYDVAREAAVSISTVSNVLNRPGRVAADTRRRVLQVADELGYLPKATAAHLARKRVGRIGVIAPFTAYPSYLRRLSGLLRSTAGAPVEVSVFDHESAATASSPVLASLPIRGAVDGLVVMGAPIEPSVEERLYARGLPVVVVDADSSRYSVVNINDHAAGRAAAEHLLELGHTRIGYVVEEQVSEYESQARRRLGGFRARLAEEPGVQLRLVPARGTMDSAREVAHGLLGSPDRPTAVMAHFDDLALGVVRAARDLDLDVPGELSVLGFDDGPVAEAAGLSTMRQPLEESGALAAQMLLEEISSRGQRRVTLLDCALVRRDTTAAVVGSR